MGHLRISHCSISGHWYLVQTMWNHYLQVLIVDECFADSSSATFFFRSIANRKSSSHTACCFCCSRSAIFFTVAMRCLIWSATTKSSRATAASFSCSKSSTSDSDDGDWGGGGVCGHLGTDGSLSWLQSWLLHTGVNRPWPFLWWRTRRRGMSNASTKPSNCSVVTEPRM